MITRIRHFPERRTQLGIGVLFCLALTFIVCNCSPPVKVTTLSQSTKQPITAGAGFGSIALARLKSNLGYSTQIGAHHDGVLKIPYKSYTAGEWASENILISLREVIEGEIGRAGYTLVKNRENSAFQSQASSLSTVRFLLAANIVGLSLNSYAAVAGNKTTSEVSIDWELYDQHSGDVIYRGITGGSAVAPKVNSDALPAAIRSATLNLLGNSEFYQAIRGSSQPPASAEIGNLKRSDSPSEQIIVATKWEDVVQRVQPGVVAIMADNSLGSGVVIDSKGSILTCYHVVEGAATIRAKLLDGTTRKCKLLRKNVMMDVAIVQLLGTGTSPQSQTLSLEESVRPGMEVAAIGCPFDPALSHTVTRGIVSGTRTIGGIEFIQTDVAISPGNSGGPLLAPSGEIIGIVSSKISEVGVEGIGFAIPSYLALRALSVEP